VGWGGPPPTPPPNPHPTPPPPPTPEDPDARCGRGRERTDYATSSTRHPTRTPDMEEIEARSAYQMAATRRSSGSHAKAGLLDLRSEAASLRLVTRLLRAALIFSFFWEGVDFVKRAQARERSNGKVHFDP